MFLLGNIEQLFCFHRKSMPENIPQSAGWNFYDLQAEYQRMQVPNDEWCLTLINKDYEVMKNKYNIFSNSEVKHIFLIIQLLHSFVIRIRNIYMFLLQQLPLFYLEVQSFEVKEDYQFFHIFTKIR